MSRQVFLENYLPDVIKLIFEYQKLSAAENPEFNKLILEQENSLSDCFVQDATLNGIKRWEKILKIPPSGTIEDRRATIIGRLNETLPYTIRRLRQMLNALCGEDGYTVQLERYSMTVQIPARLAAIGGTIYAMLRRVVPANIYYEVRLTAYSNGKIGLYAWSSVGVRLELYPWAVHSYDTTAPIRTAAASKSSFKVTVLERR